MKLDDHLDEISASLEALHPESRPQWGRLRAPELMAHFIDTYKVALKEKPLTFTTRVPKWLLKWVVIYSPLPWPKGVQAPPEYTSTAPGTLDEDRERVLAYTRQFIDTDAVLEEHPAFGRMTKADWDHLLYRHFQHHFKQFGVQ